jgi:NTP pyrophosphatase (non-canonical NTP hydrolase)
LTPAEYIENAVLTETKEYRFGETNGITPRMEHAMMGMVTEAAECMDIVKKTKIYGRALDRVHLAEEAGDVMWYLAILSDELGISFEEMWEKNIAKLRVRFPEKYTDHHAVNRDLDSERKVLE